MLCVRIYLTKINDLGFFPINSSEALNWPLGSVQNFSRFRSGKIFRHSYWGPVFPCAGVPDGSRLVPYSITTGNAIGGFAR